MRPTTKVLLVLCCGFLSPLLLGDGGRGEAGEKKYGFEADWKTGGKLSHLSEYIGTNNYEAVVEDPYVREKLEKMLGDDLDRFLQSLSSRYTIDLERANMIIAGSKPHEVGVESAILLVNLRNGQIQAGVYSRGRTKVFSKTSGYVALPQSLKIFIHWNEIYPIKERFPDSNFKWVR